ncbi:hypothetical protein MF621_003958 (plasmid) [Bacillus velezensis]|uniref:hypothetical protein n=1 Tax=Bacillus velezensis TaxID=492670 RepID=UPI000A69595E|nr:hypothetical protein [Bacillus velezensis]URJ72541.1 hypothetical protein MF619_000031 [Bacillus velezensis]URJ72559.1 hypothetical protein MF619_000014 [Bacillus velezensis]URJ80308.1 hypothetical protein MF621_003975 [Bacillus velezensis]URJ80325.1 hypothetical protein MF621_003958 [Bacillus velezensis]
MPMKPFIDTIFAPVLAWLNHIHSMISSLSVPLSHPVPITNFLGPFGLLGSSWARFVGTICSLAFIYVVAYLIKNAAGLYLTFKQSIKWW